MTIEKQKCYLVPSFETNRANQHKWSWPPQGQGYGMYMFMKLVSPSPKFTPFPIWPAVSQLEGIVRHVHQMILNDLTHKVKGTIYIPYYCRSSPNFTEQLSQKVLKPCLIDWERCLLCLLSLPPSSTPPPKIDSIPLWYGSLLYIALTQLRVCSRLPLVLVPQRNIMHFAQNTVTETTSPVNNQAMFHFHLVHWLTYFKLC